MVDFLRFHESHPPLFYFLMRPWLAVAGDSDTAALTIPVVIGVAMIPAIYFVGKSLFSKRVGLIAALLATFSPALVEHSALVRPYSLLPVLTLFSCYALIRAFEEGSLRSWVAYVATTLALIYTHNWPWLIVAGEWVAVIALITADGRRGRSRIALEWLAAQTVIGLAFLPWLPWFVYQTRHAGHAPFMLEKSSDILILPFVAFPHLLQATVLGYPIGKEGDVWTVIQSWLLLIPVLCFGISEFLRVRRSRREAGNSKDEIVGAAHRSNQRAALVVLIIVPLTAWSAAVAFSPRVDLLFPRCLVMLAPLMILTGAYWLERPRSGHSYRLRQLGLSALLTTYVVTLFALFQTTRSNAREFAAVLSAHTQPSDVVIVVPEWLASSFNRYYKVPVEQIDFPYFGREGAVDFAGIIERIANPSAINRLKAVLVDGRKTRRRVWLVMEAREVQNVSARDIARLSTPEGIRYAPAIRANQIRDELTELYGPPDTSLAIPGRITQFERFRAYLFAVPSNDDGK